MVINSSAERLKNAGVPIWLNCQPPENVVMKRKRIRNTKWKWWIPSQQWSTQNLDW
jgi:hypothetical protein